MSKQTEPTYSIYRLSAYSQQGDGDDVLFAVVPSIEIAKWYIHHTFSDDYIRELTPMIYCISGGYETTIYEIREESHE